MDAGAKLGLSVLALLLVAGGLSYVRGHDPARSGGVNLYPPCLVRSVAGLHCPGCGSGRATHALMNGDVSRAWAMNPLLVVALPVVVYGGFAWWLGWLVPGWRGRLMPRLPAWVAWWSLGLVYLYGLLRNLPWSPFSWLAPG
jgi:hypothetical protein